MILLGVDIGFTDGSLARSRYAHCAKFRRRVAAVYLHPKEGAADELAQYRDSLELLNVKRLREQEPELYQEALKASGPFLLQDEVPWNAIRRERLGDAELVSRMESYVETRRGPWIPVERLPQESRRKVVAQASHDDRISSWDVMPFQEQVNSYCKGCPIRPPNETNCYFRFSNYPSMDDFRQGFLLTLLYADSIDEEKLKHAWFSFPHLDREKKELPKDKVEELYSMVEGTEVNKRPAEFFNQVADLLQRVKPENTSMESERLGLEVVPFVDEFISAFLYRDEVYTPEEARKWLPYFETLREVASWALWDADNRWMRHRLINFKERMDTLVTALQFGDKYGLDTFVSY